MPPIFHSVSQFVADTVPSPYGLFKAVAGALAVSTSLGGPHEQARAPVAEHGWEIKLGIDAASLTGGRPSHDLMHAFNLEDSADTRSYSYYDNEGHELNKNGWAIRLRHKEDKDFEMTYKMRFPVKGSVQDTLKYARDHGFDNSDKNYDAEVDWTYSKKVGVCCGQWPRSHEHWMVRARAELTPDPLVHAQEEVPRGRLPRHPDAGRRHWPPLASREDARQAARLDQQALG